MTDQLVTLKAPYETIKLVEHGFTALLAVMQRDVERLQKELITSETIMFNAVMGALALELGEDIHIDGNWESDDEGGSALYWQVYFWDHNVEDRDALDPHPAIAGLSHVASELLGRVWRKDGTYE